MIFSVGDHIEQIKRGEKTQTRRLLKDKNIKRNRLQYEWLQDYSVQPCRTCKGIPEGRIKIIDFYFEERGTPITKEDALREGGYTPEEYEALFERMYPNWKWRVAYTFKFIPVEEEKPDA